MGAKVPDCPLLSDPRLPVGVLPHIPLRVQWTKAAVPVRPSLVFKETRRPPRVCRRLPQKEPRG